MEEFLRLKSGNLKAAGQTIPIHFGLVFHEKGFYYFDFYVPQDVSLRDIHKQSERNFFGHYFAFEGITVEGRELHVTNLHTKSVPFDEGLIKMRSVGSLTVYRKGHDAYEEENKPTHKSVFYIEVEGMRMEFSDHTKSIRTRDGERLFDLNNIERDHTKGCITYRGNDTVRGCYTRWIWSKKENSNNLIIAFPETEGYQELRYETYLSFRKEFNSLLSLINGGEVRIRREYIGYVFSPDKPWSDEEITYSFSEVANEQLNEYIPINNPFNWGDNILNQFFLFCLDNFIEKNKRFDFISAIYYMNGANRSNNLAQRFFIEIIVLERLAQKCIEGSQPLDETWIDEEIYKNIEIDLNDILSKHESLLGDTFETFQKKIAQLNIKKRATVGYKFHRLLQEANIAMTPSIKHILNIVRHKSIHYGEIGIGVEALKNVKVLDTLLRNIILNLIGYKGKRGSAG